MDTEQRDVAEALTDEHRAKEKAGACGPGLLHLTALVAPRSNLFELALDGFLGLRRTVAGVRALGTC